MASCQAEVLCPQRSGLKGSSWGQQSSIQERRSTTRSKCPPSTARWRGVRLNFSVLSKGLAPWRSKRLARPLSPFKAALEIEFGYKYSKNIMGKDVSLPVKVAPSISRKLVLQAGLFDFHKSCFLVFWKCPGQHSSVVRLGSIANFEG